MRILAVLVLAAASPAVAAPAKLTLEQVIARAIASPKAEVARGERDGAAARVAEADAARMPRFKATAFGTISPEITCDDPQCLSTSPKNFAFRFSGFFGSAQLEVTQPIYTFGKIANARAAAREGLAAQQALADEAAGDLAVDAARAYWGIKLARELGSMLDDGIEEIDKARANFDEQADVSIAEKQRVAVLVAEAKAQRIDARQGEQQAMAGLRALVGATDVEVDDAELAPVARELPSDPNVAGSEIAMTAGRPQALAAKAGAHAADRLVDMAVAAYLPDLAIVATGVIARAQGVTDPPSVFANDPYNRAGVGAVVALQWNLEPWTIAAKVDKARADARKAHAQADLAAIGATYDGQVALAEASAAKDRVAAATEGEKAARTWLAAVLQNESIGVAEPKEIADAYIAWFQMRAKLANAIFQWNVAVVRLDRALGKFHVR